MPYQKKDPAPIQPSIAHVFAARNSAASPTRSVVNSTVDLINSSSLFIPSEAHNSAPTTDQASASNRLTLPVIQSHVEYGKPTYIAADPTVDSNIEASTKTVEVLATALATVNIKSETKWLSFGPAKMRHRMFSSSCLPMHAYYSTKPWCTLKLWINYTSRLYPGTMMTHREYQVPLNTILPPAALGDCCAIVYFVKNPPGIPGLGSLHILCTPVDYVQPGYAAAVYDTTAPALATNCCREYRTASCFSDHPYT